MAGVLAALRVTLSADTAAFSTGMAKARRQASTSATAIKKSLGGVAGAFGGLTGGILAGLSVGALSALTKRALDYAGGLKEVADQLGVTTKGLQELRYAASQTGVGQEELDKGLAKLTLTMGQVAAGAEAPRKAFAAIGISVADLKGRKADEILGRIADGLGKLPDPAQRSAVGAALMGRNFQKLLPLLNEGSRGMDQLRQDAQDLGIVLTEEQIAHADETADKLEKLKRVLEARVAGVVAENAKSIENLAVSLASLATGLAKFWSQDPSKALGIIGALGGGFIGARVGGLPGAAVGTVAGFAGGRWAGSQNPTGMQARAETFRQRAGQVARSKGFFDAGTTQAQKDAIAKDPAIQANLKQFRAYMAEARKMQSTPIAMPEELGGGGADVGDFLAGGGAGRSGKDAAEEARRKQEEALRRQFDAQRALSDAKEDELRAQLELTDDYVDRQTISHQLIDIEIDQQNAELAYNLKLAERNKTADESLRTTTDQLTAANERLRILKKQQVNQQVELDRQRDYEENERVGFDIQRDRLEGERALAQTASERRRIEMEILDLAYRERKERLERILAESEDAEERRRAQRQLDAMPAQRRLDEAGVVQGTRGPLETYLGNIPRTTAAINERVESLVVDELEAVRLGINDAIMNAIGVEDPLLAGLIDLFIQQEFIAPLAEALNRARTNSSGGGGILGSILGGLSSLIGAGGGATAGLNFGGTTVQSMMALNPGVFADGGYTGDMAAWKIAGFVHGKEYVFDALSTARIGRRNLDAMRSGRLSASSARGHRGGDTHFHLTGPMTKEQARKTVTHIDSAARQRLGTNAKRGLAG